MLLRKTDAPKVAAVYKDFIASYPRPQELAEADGAVLRNRIGRLGIVDRARLLKLTASEIVARYKGRTPLNFEDLIELPGVGAYTANAVLCFARWQAVPLLDTNVIRVFGRVFSIRSRKLRARDDPELWAFAGMMVPRRRPATYNRALLDLAGTICTAVRPKCQQCPLNRICDYGRKRVGKP